MSVAAFAFVMERAAFRGLMAYKKNTFVFVISLCGPAEAAFRMWIFNFFPSDFPESLLA